MKWIFRFSLTFNIPCRCQRILLTASMVAREKLESCVKKAPSGVADVRTIDLSNPKECYTDSRHVLEYPYLLMQCASASRDM